MTKREMLAACDLLVSRIGREPHPDPAALALARDIATALWRRNPLGELHRCGAEVVGSSVCWFEPVPFSARAAGPHILQKDIATLRQAISRSLTDEAD